MVKIGSFGHRAQSKMVHVSLLLSVKEASVILKESMGKITQGHNKKTLPFLTFEIDDTIIVYIPANMLRAIGEVQSLGVNKTIKFLKHIREKRLQRLYEENTDWSRHDLSRWIKE